MSLTIVGTAAEGLVVPEVTSRLRASVASRGAATLLVPSFAQALDAQRALAEQDVASLGVRVTTPAAWAEERWGVWGDGRTLVTDEQRDLLVAHVLGREDAPWSSALPPTPGSVALLADLARAGLDRIAGAPRPEGVTPAEALVAPALAEYAALLASRGLVEGCEAMAALPGALEAAGVGADVACAGFSELPGAERELLCRLACAGEVAFVTPVGEGPAHALARDLATWLGARACELGARVSRVEPSVPASAPARPAELSGLLGSLFRPGEASVASTGRVRALLAAGPSSEPGLLADEVAARAAEGASSVVVVTPDPAAAWRALEPRLVARGVGVRAQLSVPFERTGAGRAFLAFAESVAGLAALAEGWPAPEPVPDAPRPRTVRVRLGDMSWWPPRALVDFLLSAISHVDAARARRLDEEWRGNRLLTPAAVLERLQSERDTSPQTAAATRELLRGRLGSAASKLLAPYAQGDRAQAPEAVEATAALSRVLVVARSLKELGLPEGGATGGAGLVALVSAARVALCRSSVQLRLAREVEGAACHALVTSPATAARLAPCSVDVVVLAGQTSAESAVSTAEDERSALLVAYGVEEAPRAMDVARSRFAAAVAAARSGLTWERTLFGADGSDRYPSVMLGELLACYGLGATASPADVAAALGEGRVLARSEVAVAENASASGRAPARTGSEAPAPAGRLEASERSCVLPPPEGAADARPVLSASQIESYLECPYKWFSLRRLRLRDADACFGGAEEGTFAHRVLEVTHAELTALAVERAAGEDGLARMRASDPDAMQRPAYRERVALLLARAAAEPEVRLPGSSLADEEGLARAREVLGREFEAHLAHQYQLEGGRRPLPQALVAHTAQEQGRLAALRRDLEGVLDYESGMLAGFEPRLMEWGFGRGDDVVEYAGVRVTGTVDRVDVDGHGQALVIDYKHKAARDFPAEYDAFGTEGAKAAALPPRRVQSLIYAQVVRRAFPGLRVRGALYLCTRAPYALAGAVDENLAENVFGTRQLSSRRAPRLAVPRDAAFGRGDARGMEALLDACEQAVAERVAQLLAGDVEARPADAAACAFCPVLNCERRLS